MHTFLVLCVLVEGGLIAWLFLSGRSLRIGANAANERMDQVIQAGSAIGNAVASLALKLSGLHELHADLVRQFGIINAKRDADHVACDARLGDVETRLSDAIEGCERIDSDLSLLTDDVRELVKFRDEDSKELSTRISELSDQQEQIRRKAARPASSGFGFESIRNTAQANARATDPEIKKLVELAEG